MTAREGPSQIRCAECWWGGGGNGAGGTTRARARSTSVQGDESKLPSGGPSKGSVEGCRWRYP